MVDVKLKASKIVYNNIQTEHVDMCHFAKSPILIKGEVVMHFDPELRIPRGQNLYLNTLNGKVGWRKTSIKYGKTLNHQDVDGFVIVGINFK